MRHSTVFVNPRERTAVPENDEITDIWARAVDILTENGDIGGAQRAFIRLTRPLGAVDGTLLLAVPSEFAKDFLETRARVSLTEALTESAGSPIRFAVTVDPTLEETSPRVPETETPDDPQPPRPTPS